MGFVHFHIFAGLLYFTTHGPLSFASNAVEMDTLERFLRLKGANLKRGEASQNDFNYPILVLTFSDSRDLDRLFNHSTNCLDVRQHNIQNIQSLELQLKNDSKCQRQNSENGDYRFVATPVKIGGSSVLLISSAKDIMTALYNISSPQREMSSIRTIYTSSFKFENILSATFLGESDKSAPEIFNQVSKELLNEGLKQTNPKTVPLLTSEQRESFVGESYWIARNRFVRVSITQEKHKTRIAIYDTIEKIN